MKNKFYIFFSFAILSLLTVQGQIVKEFNYLSASGAGSSYQNMINPNGSKFNMCLYPNNPGDSAHQTLLITNRDSVIKVCSTGNSLSYGSNFFDTYNDSINKVIYYVGTYAGPSYPTKYSCAYIYKTDLNNKVLDSLIFPDTYFFGAQTLTKIDDTLYIICNGAPNTSSKVRISILKLDTNFNFIDYKYVTNAIVDELGLKVAVTSQKKLLIIATNSNYPYKLIKTDRNLNVVSSNVLSSVTSPSSLRGFTKDKVGYTITFNGNINPTTFTGTPNSVIVKLDDNENELWSKFVPSIQGNPNSDGLNIIGIGKTNDNGYIAVVTNLASDTLSSLVKLDSMGNQLWYLKDIFSKGILYFANAGQTAAGVYYAGGTYWAGINQYKFSFLTIDSLNGLSNTPILNLIPNEIKIYPNPSQNIFHIIFPPNESYSLKIYNSIGQLEFSKNNIFLNTDIDLSNYSDGVYNILIESDSTHSRVVKKLLLSK